MVLTRFLCVLALSLCLAESSIAEYLCPPDSPLLPRPSSLRSQAAIHQAGHTLSDLLDSAVAGTIESGWPTENVSFSVALVSGDANDSTPFWEYHHRAARNVDGTETVDGDSQYLIGSVSKVFTALLLLKSGLDLDDPITKYLPELIGPDSVIRWEEISLRALGAHLAGIQGFYGYPEIYYTIPYFEALGFPKLSEDDFPSCGIIGLNPGCTKQQLLAGIRDTAPVTAPYLRPAYSSVSFTLLSYAMEVATGKNYSQFLEEDIVTPLHMINTGPSPGNDSRAVIPPMEGNSWGSDYGDNAPGGGLVSSTNDMSRLINSILAHAILPEPTVNAWLKPLSTTPQYNTLVGMPWEIYRSASLTPKHPHTIDLYSKRGSAVAYEAYMGLIPQYGLGFTVLTAGGGAEAATAIADAVLSTFLPAVEAATRSDAHAYLGRYSSNQPAEAAADASMTITMDDGPGLVLASLSRNGSDILAALRALWASQPVPLGGLAQTLRLYPADVAHPAADGAGHASARTAEEWRLQYDIVSGNGLPPSGLPSAAVVAGACGTWQTPGMLVYGGQAVDRVVFEREGGQVVGVRVPALGMEMGVVRG